MPGGRKRAIDSQAALDVFLYVGHFMDRPLGVRAHSMAADEVGKSICQLYNCSRNVIPPHDRVWGHPTWESRFQVFGYYMEMYFALNGCGGLPGSEKLVHRRRDHCGIIIPGSKPRMSSTLVRLSLGTDEPDVVARAFNVLERKETSAYFTLLGTHDWLNPVSGPNAGYDSEKHEVLESLRFLGPNESCPLVRLEAHLLPPWVATKSSKKSENPPGRRFLAGVYEFDSVVAELSSYELIDRLSAGMVLAHLTQVAVFILTQVGLSRGEADRHWGRVIRCRQIDATLSAVMQHERPLVLEESTLLNPDLVHVLEELRTEASEYRVAWDSRMGGSECPVSMSEFSALVELATYLICRVVTAGHMWHLGGVARLCAASERQGWGPKRTPLGEGEAERNCCVSPAFMWQPPKRVRVCARNQGRGPEKRSGGVSPPKYCWSCKSLGQAAAHRKWMQRK